MQFENRIGSINANKFNPIGLDDGRNDDEEEKLKQNFYLHCPNQEKPSKTDHSSSIE